MFFLLLACSAGQSADSITLARQGTVPLAPDAQPIASYHLAMDSSRGCRTSEWLASTLEDRSADFGEAVATGLNCSGMKMSWANTEDLHGRSELLLTLNDWASSYPMVLGNWPTAPRTLVPDRALEAEGLAGSTVDFELSGPGVLDPDLQVVVESFDGTWLLPQDGGEVLVDEHGVQVRFPAELTSPVAVIFEQAWPATVTGGMDPLPFEVTFSPLDGGQRFEIGD